jgi:hypothetical protein
MLKNWWFALKKAHRLNSRGLSSHEPSTVYSTLVPRRRRKSGENKGREEAA